jgi:hypothetical protein
MSLPSPLLAYGCQGFKEVLAVSIIDEDVLPAVPTTHKGVHENVIFSPCPLVPPG